jgi:hypothetical protein
MASVAQSKVLAIPYLGEEHSRTNDDSANHDREESNSQRNVQQIRAPHSSRPWAGNHCHYQAQLIGAELASRHGRHKAQTSPREAARAYGQARRRPSQVSDRPRLKTIM